ncbi:MAG: hypothetical protein JXM69_15120 [Anaerolineae bacterium]|nr:hypothetical protein [Anaerolineae bacterium]
MVTNQNQTIILEPPELLDIIRDLYRLNKDNKVFLTTQLGLGSSEELAEPYRRAIRREFNPDRGFPRLNLGAARKALNDFRRANADPRAEIEMMVYYVEQGVACTLQYGDIDEAFYSSLEGVFEDAIALLRQRDNPEFEAEFCPCLERIVRKTSGIGWGFHDYLDEVFYSAYPR